MGKYKFKSRNIDWPQRPHSVFKALSEFKKMNEIGSGAFSKVYKAIHIPTNVEYAIKEVL